MCCFFKKKNTIAITDAFQAYLDRSKGKHNKRWIDKGSEFSDRSMKSWWQDDDIEMYSKHNERKSVFSERFIRTLKNKIYKYMIVTFLKKI